MLITPFILKTSKVSRLKGIYRIGPHNIDILSLILGSLLGDTHAEKILLGTRIIFFQGVACAPHIKYIFFYIKCFQILVTVILKHLL